MQESSGHLEGMEICPPGGDSPVALARGRRQGWRGGEHIRRALASGPKILNLTGQAMRSLRAAELL